MLNKQTAMERAREVKERMVDAGMTAGPSELALVRDAVLADALLAVQAETLDAAARALEEDEVMGMGNIYHRERHALRVAASAIRNLKAPADAAITGKEG